MPEHDASQKKRLMLRMKLAIRTLILLLPLPVARQVLYAINYRRRLNLKAPSTFNEKVNWRIVYDRRPVLATLSSKVDSKEFVQRQSSGIQVPRTIWHGSDLHQLENVAFDSEWVLKASHTSGRVIFGAGRPDVARLERATADWLNGDNARVHRLWAYEQVRPEYILEERIGDGKVPDDYKFFVFGGRVRLIQVDRGRFGKPIRNLYTPDWEALPHAYTWPKGPDTAPPETLALMLRYASTIGASLDFVRVDLFSVSGRVYFGEATVYPAAGLSHWPAELDQQIGRYWTLPPLRRGTVTD